MGCVRSNRETIGPQKILWSKKLGPPPPNFSSVGKRRVDGHNSAKDVLCGKEGKLSKDKSNFILKVYKIHRCAKDALLFSGFQMVKVVFLSLFLLIFFFD